MPDTADPKSHFHSNILYCSHCDTELWQKETEWITRMCIPCNGRILEVEKQEGKGAICRIWPEFVSCMQTTSCLLNENISQEASRQRASAGLKTTQGSGFEFTALLEGIPCTACTNNTWYNDKFVFYDGGRKCLLPVSVKDHIIRKVPLPEQ